MKPVKQTIYNQSVNGVGNCLQACIASIFELPLSEVPNFIEYERGNSENLQAMIEWLKPMGFKPLTLWFADWNDLNNWKPPGYHMIYGYSERGIKHAVVGYQGEMVFDPHPDNTGLSTVDSYTVFVASLSNEDDTYQNEDDLASGESSVRATA